MTRNVKDTILKDSSNIKRKSSLMNPTVSSLAKIKTKGVTKTIKKDTRSTNVHLTQPKSPHFHTALRSRPKDPSMLLTPVSREIIEIGKKKENLEKEKIKTKKYREATQFPTVTFNPKDINPSNEKENSTPNLKSKFSMKLRSSGIVGIPLVKRKSPTRPKEFHFTSDKIDHNKNKNNKGKYVNNDVTESKKKFRAREIPKNLL